MESLKPTHEEIAKNIINQIEALCWADNWTTHKAIPIVIQSLRKERNDAYERAAKICSSLLHAANCESEIRFLINQDEKSDTMSVPGPIIPWIKNDPEKYNWFTDGSVFLVALQVRNSQTGETRWDFDVVEFDCDDGGAFLYYRGKSEIYDSWVWTDFEYFILLEGEMPTDKPDDLTHPDGDVA